MVSIIGMKRFISMEFLPQLGNISQETDDADEIKEFYVNNLKWKNFRIGFDFHPDTLKCAVGIKRLNDKDSTKQIFEILKECFPIGSKEKDYKVNDPWIMNLGRKLTLYWN